MIVRTRAQVRALLLRRTRLVDHENAHPAASVNIDLDDGFRELQKVATRCKWGTYLKTTGSFALATAAPVVGETYVELPVPTDCVQVIRVETQVSGGLSPGEWLAAEPVGLHNMREPRQSYGWTLVDQGVQETFAANTGSLVAGVIALFPVPSSGNGQIWYLPEFLGTTADSGASGFYVYPNDNFLQYHVYCTAEKLLISDNDSQGMLVGVSQKRLDYLFNIENDAPTAPGPRTWKRARNY